MARGDDKRAEQHRNAPAKRAETRTPQEVAEDKRAAEVWLKETHEVILRLLTDPVANAKFAAWKKAWIKTHRKNKCDDEDDEDETV